MKRIAERIGWSGMLMVGVLILEVVAIVVLAAAGVLPLWHLFVWDWR